MANTFAQLSADVAAVGGLDYSTESTTSDRWAKGGLRRLSRAGAWEWLRAHTSFALTAGDYSYALSAIASDFIRADTRTLRYAGTYLEWGSAQAIDEKLGPDWKEAVAADHGTPQYATRVGQEIWVGKIPSVSFVASNPSIYLYYYRSEAFSGNLYLPDDFYDCAVDAALAFGFTQEDDPRAGEMLQRVEQVHLPAMRAARLDIGQGDRMATPLWMLDNGSGLAGYGDGWVPE